MKKIKLHHLKKLQIDGSLDDVIKQLENYKKEYSEYTNLRIVEDPQYDGGYYHDLFGDRLETDLEESNRLAAEKERDERNEAYERQQYEKLKAKYEKD